MCTIFGVKRPSFAQVKSHDSSAIRTLKDELLDNTRVGLYFEEPLPFPHDEGPPYVDAGVASVEVLLTESKTEDMDVDVLVRLCGLFGV